MPLQICVVDWDQLKGPTIKSKYPEEGIKADLANLAMQTFMIHSGKVPPEADISFQLEGTNIASHYFQFKEKSNVLRRIMILLILKPDESSKDFFGFLKNLEKDVKNEIDNPYFTEMIKNSFNEMVAAREFVYSEDKIREKISSKAKILLDKGDFTNAQKLLSKANEIPAKLSSILMNAENLFKEKKHLEAADNYEKAAELLTEIGENDLSLQFKNKATDLRTIPKLENDLRNSLDKVEKAIKKFDFKLAIENFKKCVKDTDALSKFPTISELYSIRKSEYLEKIDALENFLKAEEKAKAAVIDLIAKEKLPKTKAEDNKKKLNNIGMDPADDEEL
ncbi:MAG: hypothetical protein ACTSO9_19850 [Candidatus Helarchaeota archaeon]